MTTNQPLTDAQLWGGPTPLPPIVWRAGRDGIGHALPKGPSYSRYLCNRMPIAERFAWPIVAKCEWCVAKLEEVATGQKTA